MASRATNIAKNLALAMVFGAGVLLGGWALQNTFLAVYFAWIVSVSYQILIFALALAVVGLMLLFAVGAVNALILMVMAIFRKNKTDDD